MSDELLSIIEEIEATIGVISYEQSGEKFSPDSIEVPMGLWHKLVSAIEAKQNNIEV